MTREQWNVTIGMCWLAAVALAWFLSGLTAALIVFFLPAILIATCISTFGKFGIDWENYLRPANRREARPDQSSDSN